MLGTLLEIGDHRDERQAGSLGVTTVVKRIRDVPTLGS